MGQRDQAIEDFNQAISLDPKDATAYRYRGFNYLYLGQYQRAVTECNQAIHLNPKDAEAYSNRGLAYNELGKNDLACVDLWKACNLGECNSLRLEQKKGYCKSPGGTYFIDRDEYGLHISTDEYGKYKITSKKVAASIMPGMKGIYFIKENKKGTYISTDRYGDFYIETESISKKEIHKKSGQKADWME